jgi:hypothetical protein
LYPVLVIAAYLYTQTHARLESGVIAPPTVRGIGLAATLPAVLKAFGKPLQSRHVDPSDVDGIVGGEELSYQGLLLTTLQGARDVIPKLASIRVSSPRWRLSNGVRVGCGRAQMAASLGAPERSDGPDARGKEWWWYIIANQDSWFRVELSSDKVVAIEWRRDWS